ncbi:unnamed protein product [Caenorhabditis bovis]|uniref:Major facilitator superfamily (MFS) profile domain-containing protein n=1 Tax=Caenorhabditis bovis TaxID=2654633 RepID=A0A8S1EET5_9PELO|nr:unnamed protein product [Caenorhabditis bovis]
MGKQLNDTDPYIKEARNTKENGFYMFVTQERFLSTHSEFIIRNKDVDSIWWKKVITIQQFGVFFGSLIFGWVSDHIGRKTVCQYSLLFSSIILLIEGFLTNTIAITVCRFVIGTQAGAMIIVAWSHTTELISPKTRFLARAFSNWPNAKVVLVAVCSFSQNWRISLHVSSALTLVASGLYFFGMPESPTWLHCHGQREKAQQVSGRVFEKSGGLCIIDLPTGIKNKSLTFSQIWKKEKYRNVIILFGAIWIMTNFTNTMLDFSEVNILNGLLTSQLLLAVVPSVLKMLLGTTEIYLGIINRRNLHLVSLFINGVSMLICGIFLTTHLEKKFKIFYVIIYLIGYSSMEFVWDACFLCVVEQVPTEVRGTVCGTCSFLSRIAGVAATNMVHVKKLWAAAPLYTAASTALLHFTLAYFFMDDSKDANLGEVGFDLRRLSRKVSQKINQQLNRFRRESKTPDSTNEKF